MAGRGDEADAEALDVVECVVEGVDLQFAAVARSRINFPDGEAAAEPAPRRPVHAAREFDECRVIRMRRRLGERTLEQATEKGLAHVLTGRVPSMSS